MQMTGVLKSRQIRAARALVDWSQEDLALAANLSIATIRKLELGNISPRDSTNTLVRNAFQKAGLEFIEPDGVRHKPEDISIYYGEEGIKKFFDDVYQTSLQGAEVIQVWPSTGHFTNVIGSYRIHHTERMAKVNTQVKVKCIITENPDITAYDYCEYRFLSRHYVDSVPFYVYGDKYAIVSFASDTDPKIIVVQSLAASESFRRQFDSMWEKATPLGRPQASPAAKAKPRK